MNNEIETKPNFLCFLHSLKWVYTCPIQFFGTAIIGIIIYGLTSFLYLGVIEIIIIDSIIFILMASLLIRYYFNVKYYNKIFILKLLILSIFDMGIKMAGMIPQYIIINAQTDVRIPQIVFLILPLFVLFLRTITVLCIYSLIIENSKIGLLNGLKLFFNNILFYFLISSFIILIGTALRYLFGLLINNSGGILPKILSFLDIVIKCIFILMIITSEKVKKRNKSQPDCI